MMTTGGATGILGSSPTIQLISLWTPSWSAPGEEDYVHLKNTSQAERWHQGQLSWHLSHGAGGAPDCWELHGRHHRSVVREAPGAGRRRAGAAAVVAAEELPTMPGLNDCYQLAESRREDARHRHSPLCRAGGTATPGFRDIYCSTLFIIIIANACGAADSNLDTTTAYACQRSLMKLRKLWLDHEIQISRVQSSIAHTPEKDIKSVFAYTAIPGFI
ncbi:hypothetical protein BDD12DRAFT_931623 [Trichophaea hybrida]|nr:hypothetical protein BDD12DRAFT_931623 [Trichophaea hybrida]